MTGERPAAHHERRPAFTSPGLPGVATEGGIGVFEWDPIRQELEWDDTLARIFVADQPGETPFGTWQRRVHPDDQLRVLKGFSELGEDLYRLVLHDGRIRYVLSRATTVVTDDDGGATRVAGVMIDVTTVQESSALITEILESISDGFLSLSADFRFLYLNRAAERILGFTRDELLDRSIWEAFPNALGTQFEEVYRDVMARRVARAFDEFYPEPLNIWFEVTAQPAAGGIVVYFQDVTERRARDHEREELLRAERVAREELAYEASHDQLTGLLNRGDITERGQAMLDAGRRVTVLFLDLDRFKLVNDSVGHAFGDALLVEAGRRLTVTLRPNDLCARLGGDEFVIILDGPSPEEAEAITARIIHSMRAPFTVGSRVVSVTVSAGIAGSGPGATLETLLRDADVALYRAKGAGRDRYAWYDNVVHSALLDQVALEADLRAALASGQLDVHYQPAYDLRSGRLTGTEALARWDHPERGPIAPQVFIPLAEDAGLIHAVGDAVLDHATRQARRFDVVDDFRMWVNVSPRQFDVPGLAGRVLDRLAAADLPPQRFGIEITESALADLVNTPAELRALSAAGVAVAIDDFGTGYSSLARLRELPIDVLKIDRSFVRACDTGAGRATVKAIIELAHALGMSTVAEGIEDDRELDELRRLGSDEGSGHHFAEPAPPGSVEVATRLPGRVDDR